MVLVVIWNDKINIRVIKRRSGDHESLVTLPMIALPWFCLPQSILCNEHEISITANKKGERERERDFSSYMAFMNEINLQEEGCG